MPSEPVVLKAVRLSASPKKILVVPLRYIGDTVLSVPLLRNLRQRYPDAELEVLVSKTAAPILKSCPYVDALHLEPKGLWALLQFLKARRYDVVILLRKSASFALTCKLSGVPVVIGYDKQRYPWGFRRWALGLDGVVEYPHWDTQTAQALHHLGMLSVLDGQTGLIGFSSAASTHLELWHGLDEGQAVSALLAQQHIDAGRPIAIVHAVSASYGKSVEIERFALAIERLLANHYQVIFSGVASDRPVYEALLAQHPQWTAPADYSVVNLAEKTSLPETVALFKRASLLLTVDSSPVHIGLATGIPKILAVYGPTNYRQWGAYDGVRPASEPAPSFLPVTAASSATSSVTASHIDIAPETIADALDTLMR